jgi:uncharacterized RDD family membrane protein YckC
MTLPLHHPGTTAETIVSTDRLQISTRRVMVNASFGERFLAAGLESILAILLCPLVLGAMAVFMRGWWPVGAVLTALAYLTLAWASGQSFGMRAMGIRFISVRTGRAPGMGRAFVRAALTLPPVVAALLLLDASFGGATGGFSSQASVISIAMFVLVVGIANELWAFVDPQRRAIPDRLSGLAAVREGQREVRIVQSAETH